MTASILVVEDEPAIQELIAVNLARNGHDRARAANAEEALGAARRRAARRGAARLDAARRVGPVARAPAARRRAHARGADHHAHRARRASDDKVAGLESGADDYVTKPFSPRELEARIQAVLRRRTPQLSKEAVEIEGLRARPRDAHASPATGKALKMGPTEFELLHFFMTHPDRVYTRAQILDQVWGDHVFIEDRTVDVHIRRLRDALSPSGHDRPRRDRARRGIPLPLEASECRVAERADASRSWRAHRPAASRSSPRWRSPACASSTCCDAGSSAGSAPDPPRAHGAWDDLHALLAPLAARVGAARGRARRGARALARGARARCPTAS